MVILFNEVKNAISVVRLIDKSLISIKPLNHVTLSEEKIKGIVLPEGILTLADNDELKLVKEKISGIKSEVKVEETKPVKIEKPEVKVEETKVKKVEAPKVEETPKETETKKPRRRRKPKQEKED